MKKNKWLSSEFCIIKNDVPVRLTAERWSHITIGHPEISDYYYEILETVENPELICEGDNDAKIAIKNFQSRFDKFIVIIFKEINADDGFIITAYFANNIQKIIRKKIIWKQPN